MFIKHISAALLGLGLLIGPAMAQTGAPVSPDPARVEGGTFDADTAHTRVWWSVRHFGFNDYFGEFTGTKATLDIDPQNIASAKVSVEIPVESVSTSNAKLDNELKSAEWFDPAQYPTITFTSTKVTQTGPKTADIEGEVSWRGVTKPVTLKAEFIASGDNPMTKAYTLGFHAMTQLKRSDFNVKNFIPAVSDEVNLIISIAFERR